MKTSNARQLDSVSNGRLLAFMGLPGSGKSTTARSLSNLVANSIAYLEPEEQDWPLGVRQREKFGYFTAITWFRSMRVPLLLSADAARQQGIMAIVDSYYDKLLASYIDHPPMKWLLPPGDPYFEVARQMAKVDEDVLPNVDCLIFLRVTEDRWQELLRSRGRSMDKEDAFLAGFSSQGEFLRAAEAFAQRSAAHLIVHDQQLGSANETAKDLLDRLVANRILSRNE